LLCIEKEIMTMNDTDLHYDAVIVGLGKTGLSCFRYLFNQGLSLAITDSRKSPPELEKLNAEFNDVHLYLGEINKEILLASDKIIISPGISLDEKNIKVAIEKKIPVLGDIELFSQKASAPILAISGSNGKSTVTSIVAEMAQEAGLRAHTGGNIGTPVLDLLRDNQPDLYILELSSFQLETTFSLNAHASVVLNISSDHMDRYSSIQDYVNAKRRIFSGDGLMILNKDEKYSKSMVVKNRKNIYFTLSEPDEKSFGLVKYNNETWLCHGKNKIITKDQLKIKGDHNISNALAAMALAHSVNISSDVMCSVLKNFSGLEHRCQLVKSHNNINWYNDSKATNVGACIASIEGLHKFGNIILIAGGDSKGSDLFGLNKVIEKYVKKVFLLGIDANKISQVLSTKVDQEFVSDINEAVQSANKLAVPGDLILLAPACSSLDMYQNFKERGDAFTAAVNAL